MILLKINSTRQNKCTHWCNKWLHSCAAMNTEQENIQILILLRHAYMFIARLTCHRGFKYADCIPCKKKWMSWVGYNTTCDGEAPVLEIWEVWSTFSLPLLPGPLWPGVVVTLKFLFIGEIELFENYIYSNGILDAINYLY